jgi:tRNA(fMet)-specific endonuclease VapC
MAQYLLDTNHLSRLITVAHPLGQRLSNELQQEHTFAIAVPILTEMLYGISLLPRATQNLTEWARLRPLFTFYNLDEVDARMASELQVSLRRSGWQLATVDALIAAVALRYSLILLTTDRDFRAVPNLQFENWLNR